MSWGIQRFLYPSPVTDLQLLVLFFLAITKFEKEAYCYQLSRRGRFWKFLHEFKNHDQEGSGIKLILPSQWASMTPLFPSEYIQYFVLTTSFPSLAVISLHDSAGSSLMVPRGTVSRKRQNMITIITTYSERCRLWIKRTVMSINFTFSVKKIHFDFFLLPRLLKCWNLNLFSLLNGQPLLIYKAWNDKGNRNNTEDTKR